MEVKEINDLLETKLIKGTQTPRYRVTNYTSQRSLVLIGRDNQKDLDVAIKTIEEPDETILSKFENEKQYLDILHGNPHVITAFDYFDIRAMPFLVMELAKTDLSAMISRSKRPLGLEFLVQAIPQICDGLDGLHKDIGVHRDMKPKNVFIMPDATLKIGDLGSVGGWTDVGVSSKRRKGTLKYQADEVVEEWENSRDVRADIYSLGLIMYELLTGHYMFREISSKQYKGGEAEYVKAHLADRRKIIKGELARLGETHIVEAIRRCLAPVDQRYSSALELREDIVGGRPAELAIEVIPTLTRKDRSLELLRRKTLDVYVGYIESQGFEPFEDNRRVIHTLDTQQCKQVLQILDYASQHRDPLKVDQKKVAEIHSTLQKYHEFVKQTGI